MNIYNYFQQLKQVNLFPKENKHEHNDIKQQMIATRVYLVLLFSMFFFKFPFHLLLIENGFISFS